jgi:PadR family transcriptional regulator PadR
MLQRMQADGWLSDGWEDPAESDGQRPARRYYELTDKGRLELGALIAAAAIDERFVAFFASQGAR